MLRVRTSEVEEALARNSMAVETSGESEAASAILCFFCEEEGKEDSVRFLKKCHEQSKR
jgi:hypothetical protein